MNTIRQLSVFLENKSGRLNEVLGILGNAEIRIIAASVADTSEYGILRLITTDPERAFRLLKEHNVGVNLSDVIAISCDSMAGTFARELKPFADAGIGIEYMYCFSVRREAYLILRTTDPEKALQVIRTEGLKGISQGELEQI